MQSVMRISRLVLSPLSRRGVVPSAPLSPVLLTPGSSVINSGARPSWHSWPSLPVIPSRPLFTDTFLHLDKHRKRRHKAQLRMANAEVKTRVREEFAESGLKNIFIEDLDTFLYLATDQQDMEFMVQVLSSACHPDSRIPPNIRLLLRNFFRNCQELQLPQVSMELMADPNVRHLLLERSKDTLLDHLMVLYNAAMYQEVLDEVEKTGKEGIEGCLTLAAAAGHQLRSQSALDQLTRIVNKAPNRPRPRAYALIAHLAFLLGENGHANDILSLISDSSSMPFNVKLAINLECSRVQEALDITHGLMKRAKECGGKIRPRVSFDLMKRLIDSVCAEADPTSKQHEQLNEVCDLVEKYAIVLVQPLEEIVMMPIGNNPAKFK